MEQQDLNKYCHKVKSIEELIDIVGEFSLRSNRVVMCHGTFDIVHPGHIRHLLYAKSKGDILIASLTSDAHITKSNMRPYVPEGLRALNLAAFEMVDYVIIDKQAKPLDNINQIKPDIFCKGYEYFKDNAMPPKTLEEKEAVESYGGKIIFTPGDIVYSSSQLLETQIPHLASDKLKFLLDAENLTLSDFKNALASLSGIKVHVIGDTIIDSLTQCSMIGGMTKTPTMSVRHEEKQNFSGGAAIVAKHLCAAGADVTFTTLLGDDEWKDFLLNDLNGSGIKINPIIDASRPTTNKNAIVVDHYRLLKIDTLDNRCISDELLQKFSDLVKNTPADIIVFSDFRHGIYSKKTIATLIDSIPQNVIRVADSQVASRWGNILEFQGFDLITPNEREARFALGDQDSVIRPLGTELYNRSNSKYLILKLGDRGVMVFRDKDLSQSRSFFTIDSFAENVVDPVGAGDALLAYASLALKATQNPVIASVLGNLAAAVECSKSGNIPVYIGDILAKLDKISTDISYGKGVA